MLPVPDYVQALEQPVKGLRVGVPAEYFGDGLDPEVRAAVESAIERLRAAGCTIHPVSLPHTRYAIPTYYLVATAEASANLARFDGVRYGFRAKDANTLIAMYRQSRDIGFGAEVKRRILLGTYALSAGYYDAYYKKAQQVRTLLTRDFLAAFEQVDVLVTPTAPTPAFKLGEKTDDPLSMYLADIYTVTASLAGICGISVPCGQSSQGLPIGAQILGKHFDEASVLRAACGRECGKQWLNSGLQSANGRGFSPAIVKRNYGKAPVQFFVYGGSLAGDFQRLVVTLLRCGTGEAECLPIAYQEPVVVDAFAALRAGYALPL